MSDEPTIMRNVIEEPGDGTVGFGIAHVRNAGPHETEYQIEQLWSTGEVGTVYIGDADDALALIAELAEVVAREQ